MDNEWLSSQFRQFGPKDKKYKGVHIQHRGRGNKVNQNEYTYRYMFNRPTGYAPDAPRKWDVLSSERSTIGYVQKDINRLLENGYIAHPETGMLIHSSYFDK
jgi:hypothetical protein